MGEEFLQFLTMQGPQFNTHTVLMNGLTTPVRETLVGGSEAERWRCGGGDAAAERKRVSSLSVKKP